MTVSIYPSTLPQPSALSVAAMERRLMSSINSGLPQARPLQFDYVGYETMEFEFAADQIAIFDSWWTNDLVFGGRWFTATWLHTNGLAAICRFNAPTYSLMGYGKWKVSIKTEIQGVYGSTAFDREPGGSRDYDLLWQVFNYSGLSQGTNLSVSFDYIISGESGGSWFLNLYTHNLGTLVPAGAVVDFTSVSVFANPTDPAISAHSLVVPDSLHLVSTTVRKWWWVSPGGSGSLFWYPGGYARYYTPINTAMQILIDGVRLPATITFNTRPIPDRLGYETFFIDCNIIYD